MRGKLLESKEFTFQRSLLKSMYHSLRPLISVTFSPLGLYQSNFLYWLASGSLFRGLSLGKDPRPGSATTLGLPGGVVERLCIGATADAGGGCGSPLPLN